MLLPLLISIILISLAVSGITTAASLGHPSQQPTNDKHYLTTPTSNQVVSVFDIHTNETSLLSNIDVVSSIGILVELDGVTNVAGGRKSSSIFVPFQQSSSTDTSTTQASSSSEFESLSEEEEEDRYCHVDKKGKTSADTIGCEECKKETPTRIVGRLTVFDLTYDQSPTGIVDLMTPQSPPMNEKTIFRAVKDKYRRVFATYANEDHCEVLDPTSDNFMNVDEEKVSMTSVNHKVVYLCEEEDEHDEKIGRCTKSGNSYDARYYDDGRMCHIVWDLDRSTYESRAPIDTAYKELHQTHPELRIGDVNTIRIDDVVRNEDTTGVSYGYNIRLDIMNNNNGPFKGGRDLRGQRVGMYLDTMETGGQVHLLDDPLGGANGAMHEGIVQNGLFRYVGVRNGRIENDINGPVKIKLGGLLCTEDPRTCNDLAEITFLPSINRDLGSWPPEYSTGGGEGQAFDYDKLVETSSTPNVQPVDDDDYVYLEDEVEDATDMGSANEDDTSNIETCTEIANDWIYGEENCYNDKVRDTYTRKVPVVGAENEYTAEEDAQALSVTISELKLHRDHTDDNPVLTVRFLFVNENPMLFRNNNNDYNSMAELLIEIGYEPMHYYAYGAIYWHENVNCQVSLVVTHTADHIPFISWPLFGANARTTRVSESEMEVRAWSADTIQWRGTLRHELLAGNVSTGQARVSQLVYGPPLPAFAEWVHYYEYGHQDQQVSTAIAKTMMVAQRSASPLDGGDTLFWQEYMKGVHVSTKDRNDANRRLDAAHSRDYQLKHKIAQCHTTLDKSDEEFCAWAVDMMRDENGVRRPYSDIDDMIQHIPVNKHLKSCITAASNARQNAEGESRAQANRNEQIAANQDIANMWS